MKRILSLMIVFTLLSTVSTGFAADITEGTDVTYNRNVAEQYLVTVPAELTAGGESGEVIVTGAWKPDSTLTVTADSTVEMTTDVDSAIRYATIHFDGITQSGSNTETIEVSEPISVDAITDALFGTWTGHFEYQVGFTGNGGAYAATFSDNSWEEIIEACEDDAVPSTWNVGDTKPIEIDGTEYNIQIIGKDHDTYTAGGTAPLTFQLVEIYTKACMDSTNGRNNMGWSGSEMRTTTLSTILSEMPSEVQSAIKAVDKQTLKGSGIAGNPPLSELETTSDKLFLLSEVEVFGTTLYSQGFAEGSRYAYYANGGSAVKTYNGSTYWWWLRGPHSMSTTLFNGINANGILGFDSATFTNGGVSFGFCF